MRRCRSFTLIELLIVVAIIGILAVIAVPQFSNALIRTQISRACSDLRNIGNAMEAYRLDYSFYPKAETSVPVGCLSKLHCSGWQGWGPLWQVQLTTPVPYIQSEAIIERHFYQREKVSPLQYNGPLFDPWQPPITYGAATSTEGYFDPLYNDRSDGMVITDKQPFWIVHSCGPDHIESKITNGRYGTGRFIYDVSNGLISFGDLVRGGGSTHDTRFGVFWAPQIPLDQRQPGLPAYNYPAKSG
ncbi:MAG TPA: prepilin-type N-terminal cleavage/methylation domain-containing protein [bacterium]|nr:prepilin-type N-terminal cleavage/methylation domain-containing protein [bacterium]HQP97355.1 prepilin-type N-terminal cleavage/methylation domain-containing protein [bacterium]